MPAPRDVPPLMASEYKDVAVDHAAGGEAVHASEARRARGGRAGARGGKGEGPAVHRPEPLERFDQPHAPPPGPGARVGGRRRTASLEPPDRRTPEVKGDQAGAALGRARAANDVPRLRSEGRRPPAARDPRRNRATDWRGTRPPLAGR